VMKTITLLGRGPSLKYFNELDKSEFVVLSNDFDREISEIEEFRNYLKKQTIHLVLNMVIGGANGYHSIDFFNKFNVIKLIRPYVIGIRIPGSSGQNIKLKEHFLGMHHRQFMNEGRKYAYDYCGTGMAALAYTMVDNQADVVNVIGLDFYDNLNYNKSNYLVPDNEGREFKRDFWKQEEIQENFYRIVASHPKIQVNLNTICQTWIPEILELKNLNINTIKN